MSSAPSALIVGASRGLGLAIVQELLTRGWEVMGTRRGDRPGPLNALRTKYPKSLAIETVDIDSDQQISALASRLEGRSFDLLFVTAGVANEGGMQETIDATPRDEFVRVMVTNALSPMRALERLKARVRATGTIGVMSSGQGSIANNDTGANDVYRASKAALNMLMKSFSARHGSQHPLLLLAPGWVRTDMGGEGARFSVEEVIGDVVSVLTGQQGHPGLRYLDRFGKAVLW